VGCLIDSLIGVKGLERDSMRDDSYLANGLSVFLVM
jgi:hypothetical protein